MTYKKHISQSNDLLDRFSSAFAGLKSHSNLPSGTTPFIWAIAVLIIVIFSAFYFNVRANNETILRTNLMKSTAKVADNIEMRMRGISANMARMIEKMELDGINPAVVNKYGREIISSSPEVILLRVIEPSGKGLESSILDSDEVTSANTTILTTRRWCVTPSETPSSPTVSPTLLSGLRPATSLRHPW